MITKQQYFEALEIIDLFHRQQGNTINNRVLTKDWARNQDISVRCYNILTSEYNGFEFVDQITKRSFLVCHNAGKKTWIELEPILNNFHET